VYSIQRVSWRTVQCIAAAAAAAALHRSTHSFHISSHVTPVCIVKAANITTLEQVLKLTDAEVTRIVGMVDPAMAGRLYAAIQEMNTADPAKCSTSPSSARSSPSPHSCSPSGSAQRHNFGSEATLQVPPRKGFRARLLHPKRWGSSPQAADTDGKQ
jgi:hypothetical protein